MIPVLLLATLVADAQTPTASGMARTGPVSVEHAGGPFGVGIAVGAPTGIAGKLWMGDWSAIAFSVGGAMGIYNDIGATADYLFQFRPFDVGDPEISVQVHMGPGVHLGGNTAVNRTGRWLVGPRGTTGFSIMKRDMPLDLYMEVSPTIYLVDGAGWSMNGQIGIRHYM
tara:strand:+ start:453 stop:959 length:507 start_codon:yes stop_codon:yes gene_type:complete